MTAIARRQPDITIEPGWGQGRATYGGLIGALMVARVRGVLADADLPLRTATVSFVAPVAPGDVAIEATILRAGGSATQAQALMRQSGNPVAALLASFGAVRPSAITVDRAETRARPSFPEPASLPGVPQLPGVTPDFMQHVEFRVARGHLPFTGAPEPDFGGWMRFRDPIAHVGVEHLVGLVDAWAPAVTPLFTTLAPVSTLSWTIELFAQPRPHSGEDYWQYDVRTDGSAEGYAHTEALVWDSDGVLIAISRQTVAVFA